MPDRTMTDLTTDLKKLRDELRAEADRIGLGAFWPGDQGAAERKAKRQAADCIDVLLSQHTKEREGEAVVVMRTVFSDGTAGRWRRCAASTPRRQSDE